MCFVFVQTKSYLQNGRPNLPVKLSLGTLLQLKLMMETILISTTFPAGILIPPSGFF